MMPLYIATERATGKARHLEAPTNRAVLMHLAAEMFDVALVKIETVTEEGEAAPRRRGRAAKAPPAVQDEAQGEEPGPDAAEEPASAEPPATREWAGYDIKKGEACNLTTGERRKMDHDAWAAGEDPPEKEAAPAASDALIDAEAARASGKPLFERMGDLANGDKPADPLVDPETGEVFEKREPAPAAEKE